MPVNDNDKRFLSGSPNRDNFKRQHKELCSTLWSTDIDFMWVDRSGEGGIVAVLDYKKDDRDSVSFAEVIAYNHIRRLGIPVYIVVGDVENWKFRVFEFVGGDHHPKPPVVKLEKVIETNGPKEFEAWEKSVRTAYARARGFLYSPPTLPNLVV